MLPRSAVADAFARVDWLVATTAVLVGLVMAWLSVLRYNGFNADFFDLGLMAQGIASVRRGEPLVFTYADGQMSMLALHAELVYFLLALPYALWPDPRLLVSIQAALFALGALPAYRLGLRHTTSRFGARCIALIYLLYPTALAGVLRDIHGDQLAMPLLLFALDALDRRAERAYWLWAVLALGCKFYVALPVALLALPLWHDGRRSLAVKTALVGLAYGAVAFLLLRPLFSTAETAAVQRGFNYLVFYFGNIEEIRATAGLRLLHGVVVIGPLALIAWRGWPWLLPAIPVFGAALLSTVGISYGYGSHHYGVVVPFLVMATAVGAGTLARQQQVPGKRPRSWRGDLGLTTAIVALCSVALVNWPLNPLFWLSPPGYGFDGSAYGVSERDAVKTRFLRQIPADAPIASSLFLAPHLADREVIYAIIYEDQQTQRPLTATLPLVDYLVADALLDFRQIGNWGSGAVDGGAGSERAAIGQALRDPSFGLVAMRDGLVLLQQNPPAGQALAQRVEQVAGVGRPLAAFGQQIGLVQAQIEPLDARRFRAVFEWQPLGSQPLGEYVAVSTLDGLENARMPHLPGYALLPSSAWQQGQAVRETFEVELPPDTPPGRYAWRVGWYDLTHPEAHATDERSRLGETFLVAIIEVR